MRLAQFDILDFIKNPDYKERTWPEEYWPVKDIKANEQTWNNTINGFLDDLKELKDIVNDPNTDFTGPIPHAPKYTIFREILMTVVAAIEEGCFGDPGSWCCS